MKPRPILPGSCLLAGWVTSRWSHSGTNMLSRPDPLTILREAKAGASFRCVEYSTVMVGAAQAMGMPARTIGLKTRQAATTASSAGHVVVEVWLKTHQKWAMVDPQFGYIPVLDGVLLNAVELQQALADGNKATLLCPEGPVGWLERTHYLLWIGPYLFYFDSAADQRVFNDPAERSGGALMPVPEGAPQLEVFQRRSPLRGKGIPPVSMSSTRCPTVGPS